MKPIVSTKRIVVPAVIYFTTILLLFSYLLFSSFTTHKMADDFLRQLGITKTGADEKITNSILGGYIDAYGVKNAKNIALGNRKAVALDLLAYTKKQVSSQAFIKEYTEMKNRHKPEEYKSQTPDEMKAQDIANAKKFVADMEAAVKKADPGMKPIFEKNLLAAQKSLKDAQDPNNKHHVSYARNYDGMIRQFKEIHSRQLADWESKYPSNHLLYVKKRLLEFMDATKDIDFNAELTTRNGKKVFVNREYERKDSRWKMAFRAGKEVVEPAREFVQKWIEEIN